ncbi:MAG: fibronectin type III domain-containing protein [Candidatus Sumerlaeia bacterium]|nr:fibronectin type III domain-containing protein [Candidatus Sumerlaeia bacterium]
MNVLNRQVDASTATRYGRKLKAFSRLTAGAALIATLSTAAHAQEVQYFVASGQPGQASSTFQVGVAMTGNNVGPLDAYSLKINYDAAHFDAVNVSTPDLGTESFLFDVLELGPATNDGGILSRVVAAAYSGSPETNPNNGRFATVTFTRSSFVTASPTWSIEANPNAPGSAFISGGDSLEIPASVTFVPSPDPATPANPNPADGDPAVATGSTLSWTLDGIGGADEYEVRLWQEGESRPTDPTATPDTPSFNPGGLDPNTSYNWDVVTLVPGASTQGPTWSFTTGINESPATIAYQITGDPEAPNSPVTLSVFLDNNDIDLGAFALAVNFDPSALQYIDDSVSFAPSGEFSFPTSSVNATSGQVRVTAASDGTTMGDAEGLLFTAGFMTTATPGSVDALGIPENLIVGDHPDVPVSLVAQSSESEPIAKVFERLLSFEPLPVPVNPTPADGADEVIAPDVAASWELDGPAVIGSSYEVYLWEDGEVTPVLVDTTTDLNTTLTGLDPFTTYNWQVINRAGSRTAESDVWSFTTIQDPALAIVEYALTGDTSVPDSQFKVDVSIANNTLPVGAFAFAFTYDPSQVSFTGGPANAVADLELFEVNEVSPGRVNVAGATSDADAAITEGDLFNITFSLVGAPSTDADTGFPTSFTLIDQPESPEGLLALDADTVVIPHIFRALDQEEVLEAPGTPINPTPANGALNVAVEPTFSWDVDSDGDDADSFNFTIWPAGTSKPATPTQTGLTDSTTTVSGLDFETEYVWQVDAVNLVGTTAGPNWSFTTTSDPALAVVEYAFTGNTTIPDSQFSVDVSVTNNTLPIGAFAFAFTYDPAQVTFTGGPANAIADLELFEVTEVAPGQVNVAGATSDADAAITEGDLFEITFSLVGSPDTNPVTGFPTSFVLDDQPDSPEGLLALSADVVVIPHTFLQVEQGAEVLLPGTPTNPNPADGATNVAANPTFSWDVDSDGDAADSFNFTIWPAGTSKPATPTQTGLTDSTTTVSGLDFETDYVWQVDAVNLVGTTAGPNWSFTTESDPEVAVIEYTIIGSAVDPDEEFNLFARLTNNDQLIGGYAFTITFDADEVAFDGDPSGTVSEGGLIVSYELVAPGQLNVASIIADESQTFAEGTLFTLPFSTTGTPGAVDGFGIPTTLILGDSATVPDSLVTFGAQNDPIPVFYERVQSMDIELPGEPINPNPFDGATGVAVDVTLTWEQEDGGPNDGYEVFLWEAGTTKPEDPTATVTDRSYTVSELDTLTEYNWSVTAFNLLGETSSDEWSFTTAFNEQTAVIAYTVLGNAADAGTTITVLASLEQNVHDIGIFSFSLFYDEAELTPLGDARPVPGSNFENYDQLVTSVIDNERVTISGVIIDENSTAANGALFEFDFVTNVDLDLDGFGIPENLVLGNNPLTPNGLITFVDDMAIGHRFERRASPPAEISVDPDTINASAIAGSNPFDDSFILANIGMGADLNYTITSDQSWVDVEPGSETGTLAAGDFTNVILQYDAASLEPGTYTATVTIADEAAINTPQTVTVNLTIIGTAVIVADPLLIQRTIDFGMNADPEVVTVSNVGTEDLNYTIELLDGGDDWLSASPAMGTVAPSESTTFTLSFDVSEVPGGVYNARVRVTDPAAFNDPVDINVQLTVIDGRALIAVNPESIEAEADFPNNAAPTTFTLTNDGNAPLFYEIVSSEPTWLAVAPTTGTLVPTASTDIDVTFDVAGIEPGTYEADIIITGDDAQNSPVTIPVTVTINETRPTIALDPTEINVAVLPGNNADPESFSITNTGASTLNYSVDTADVWVDVSATTGSLTVGATDFIDLTFSTELIPVGEYTTTVTVSDPAASNSPQVVTVNLTVLDPRPAIAFDPEAIEVETDLDVNPADEDFTILTFGEVSGSFLNYELSTDAGWISVNPTTGTLVVDGASSDTITLSYDIVGVEPGTYTANVIATSDEAQNSPVVLPVTITINETRPIIALDPEVIDLSIVEGNDAEPTTFTVTNAGAGVLNYDIALGGEGAETWIALSATTGTLTAGATDSIDVTFTTAQVPVGTYSATIIVSDPAAGNSPQEIVVNLEVLPPPTAILALSRETININVAEGTDADNVLFDVENSGNADLNYSISVSVGEAPEWVSVNPSSGSVAGGGMGTITVSFNTSELAVGQHDATITVSDPNAENSPQSIFVSASVFPTQIEFNFTDDEEGWIFEFDPNFFVESFPNHNEDRGALEITTVDNTNTFSYWRTDPNNPIQIATPGASESFKAPRSKHMIAGDLGDDSLYHTSWTVYADTPATATPSIRLRIMSEDFAISHELVATSTGNTGLVPTAGGRTYDQYFSQPGHIDTFHLYFDVLNFAPEYAVADATLGLERVSVQSLGTASLGAGTELVSYNFLTDTNGFTFRTVEDFLAPAFPVAPDDFDIGLGITGVEEEGTEPSEVIFGWWGLESDIPMPAGQLVNLSFTVRSDVPVGQENEVSTFRLRVNDSSYAYAAVMLTHPAEGAVVPSYDEATDEYLEVTYNVWLEIPAELEGENFIFSFDFLSSPGALATVDPAWAVGLVDLTVTAYDL